MLRTMTMTTIIMMMTMTKFMTMFMTMAMTWTRTVTMTITMTRMMTIPMTRSLRLDYVSAVAFPSRVGMPGPRVSPASYKIAKDFPWQGSTVPFVL